MMRMTQRHFTALTCGIAFIWVLVVHGLPAWSTSCWMSFQNPTWTSSGSSWRTTILAGAGQTKFKLMLAKSLPISWAMMTRRVNKVVGTKELLQQICASGCWHFWTIFQQMRLGSWESASMQQLLWIVCFHASIRVAFFWTGMNPNMRQSVAWSFFVLTRFWQKHSMSWIVLPYFLCTPSSISCTTLCWNWEGRAAYMVFPSTRWQLHASAMRM